MIAPKLAALLLISSVIAGVIERQENRDAVGYTRVRCSGRARPISLDSCIGRYPEEGDGIESISVPDNIICQTYSDLECGGEEVNVYHSACINLAAGDLALRCILA
ncbi:hypothetical protein TESG_08287 [Trichophyton tonsurans CBS 112818]|uniref:Cyanovirin-N domain-containing protein n=2 Tax=Trichophyton TaxID=5550 RepID=F2PLW4_TRIEC|nr:hypothetical protein TESG_08287 [Trichophyton tonsurans CBS 112818]EGE02882.1 hypothetical protein TEQG_01920 [Trichophyton equinum CBS 127.97]